uniref:Uncharacterized protein n=1 Tax=Arundo donax TaxID=35708 RepID=A0A0A9TSE8_ARUDO
MQPPHLRNLWSTPNSRDLKISQPCAYMQ